MTEQPGSRTLSGTPTSSVAPESIGHDSFHGRPASWVAVAITVIGFIIGGLAFASPPTWWLVYTGGGIALLGFIVAGFARMTEDWY
jgi:hypothetical protein